MEVIEFVATAPKEYSLKLQWKSNDKIITKTYTKSKGFTLNPETKKVIHHDAMVNLIKNRGYILDPERNTYVPNKLKVNTCTFRPAREQTNKVSKIFGGDKKKGLVDANGLVCEYSSKYFQFSENKLKQNVDWDIYFIS